MNLSTLQYFVELSKELNMSKTAHKLHMSQQTLSFHIQKLEEYYGTPLFHRKPKFCLTYAGEILLKDATDILSRCDATMDRMAAISGTCVGQLRVSISAYPAEVILPMIVPAFLEKWPNIRLHFFKMNMMERIKSILDCNLDIAIGIYDSNDPHISAESLYYDQLYIVVTDALLVRCFGHERAMALKSASQESAELSDFASLPWMLLSGTSSHLGKTVDDLFRKISLTPNVVVETQSLDLLAPLLPMHIGAMICGRLRVTQLLKLYPTLNCFPLKTDAKKLAHNFMSLINKDRDLPAYTQDFLDLAKEAFSTLDQSCVLSNSGF